MYTELLEQAVKRDNGVIDGLVYVQGRMAFTNGASIFDCPFETGSDKSELWIDGYMFAEKGAA